MKKEITQKIINSAFYFNGLLLVISIFAGFLKPTFMPLVSVIGLFFPLLGILNALFLLLFLIRRKRIAVVSLILLLSGIYQVSLVFNISNKENIQIKTLNLVSFNTGNADTVNTFTKRQEVFKNPVFQESDIICLQEFIPKNEIGISVLEAFKYKKSIDYYGIEESDSNGLSVYTNYEIIKYGWLKQDTEDTYALWALLAIDNDTIKIINVQLQSIRLEEDEVESMTEISQIGKLPGNISSIYSKLKRGFLWREEQIGQLSELIKKSKYPIILCGDFNDPPSSFSYNELSKLLKDAFMEKGDGFGFTYAGGMPFLRIDYFMVSEEINVIAYKKINKTHSDHYLIEVEVKN